METHITPSRIEQSSGITGIPDGISYGQNERVDELNSRIFDRFYPEQTLKPNLDFRPVQTKFAHFPMIDRRSKMDVNTSITSVPDFTTSGFFVPAMGRKSGFINNVNTESELRNQYFALQRGADQGVYVPASTSDLYKISVPTGSNQMSNPHQGLSVRPTFSSAPNPNTNPNIGKDFFMNNTRTQLRNSVDMK